MSARLLMSFLSAAMLAGCAVPDIYSLPDLARGKPTASKGVAVDAAPVLLVVDGEDGPGSCSFRPLLIYQSDVPPHNISYSEKETHSGRVAGTGSGNFALPEEEFFTEPAADGRTIRPFSSFARERDVPCDQIVFEIDIKCESGSCPPYIVGERSDRGSRVPMPPVLVTNF
jgi:hypothetical protein